MTISSHTMMTPASSSSTTGVLNASPGDLAIIAISTSTSTTGSSVSGAGLNWINVYDVTASTSHAIIFIAPVSSVVTSQTVTINVAGASTIGGSIIAVAGGVRLGKVSIGSSLGTTSVSRTVNTIDDGSLVLALFRASDTVWTTPATAIDNDGTLYSGNAGSISYPSGSSVIVAATSAGGNLSFSLAYEVSAAHTYFNNATIRPHLFSPGLAR